MAVWICSQPITSTDCQAVVDECAISSSHSSQTQANPRWWPLESHFWTCPKHMLPCNDDLSLSALRWNGLEKSSKCQGWYWSQTSNYSRSSWNFWVFNTKVQHYLNRRIIQYQVMIFPSTASCAWIQSPKTIFRNRVARESWASTTNGFADRTSLPNSTWYHLCAAGVFMALVFFLIGTSCKSFHNWEQTPHHSRYYVELMLQSFFTTFAYPPVLFGALSETKCQKWGGGGVNMV